MTDTDRKKVKDQQIGELIPAAGIVSASNEVTEMHSRTFVSRRPYAANDSAAVTFTLANTRRKGRVRGIYIDTTTTVTGNATNYEVFTFSAQYPNGDAVATLGSWNTHTSAQNSITANVTASVSINSAVSVIPAGAKVRCVMAPQGTGMNVTVADTAFTVDIEEI